MTKRLQYIFATCLFLLAGIFTFTISSQAKGSLSISEKKLTLCKDSVHVLGVMNGSKRISNRSVKWTSSKPRVATVNRNGVVSAKRNGSTKITAYYRGSTFTCKVKVKNLKTYTVGTSKRVTLKGTLKYVKSVHIGNGTPINGYVIELSKPVCFEDYSDSRKPLKVVVKEVQVAIDHDTYRKYRCKKVKISGRIIRSKSPWHVRNYYMENTKTTKK